MHASDALYGFVAWLTTRKETMLMGYEHDGAWAADALKEFTDANGIGNPSPEYPDSFVMPECKHPDGFVQYRNVKPPMCPHCKALAPTRKELEAKLAKLEKYKDHDANCRIIDDLRARIVELEELLEHSMELTVTNDALIADLEEKIQRMDSAMYQNRFDDWVEREKKLQAELNGLSKDDLDKCHLIRANADLKAQVARLKKQKKVLEGHRYTMQSETDARDLKEEVAWLKARLDKEVEGPYKITPGRRGNE